MQCLTFQRLCPNGGILGLEGMPNIRLQLECAGLLQAAFGRNLLSVTSFFTYVGLGLGFLGSGLALPFGLYILLLQRDPEKYIQVSLRPSL